MRPGVRRGLSHAISLAATAAALGLVAPSPAYAVNDRVPFKAQMSGDGTGRWAAIGGTGRFDGVT